MTVRRTSFAIAVAALVSAAPALAQEPSPEAAPRVAVPRASRARAEGEGASTREVRAPRRVERESGESQEARPRLRTPTPEAPPVALASDEQQGGARRPGGSGASGRPSGGGGGGRSGASGGATARPRQGGVRSPDVNGGYGGQRYAQAVPRGRAPHTVVAGRNYNYGHRYYYRPGLGYYYHPYYPYSWYAGYGYGWPAYAGWPGYYGNLGYYGSVGVYGPYGGAYYGGGYGYGAYGGPYGYSIGGVRLKVNPKDAEVYVDGYYAGIVDDFDGTWQQLRLDDGAYRIEIRKPGLATLTFDVQIQPGRTITYRGDMLGPP